MPPRHRISIWFSFRIFCLKAPPEKHLPNLSEDTGWSRGCPCGTYRRVSRLHLLANRGDFVFRSLIAKHEMSHLQHVRIALPFRRGHPPPDID